jgi:hypothetical protein
MTEDEIKAAVQAIVNHCGKLTVCVALSTLSKLRTGSSGRHLRKLSRYNFNRFGTDVSFR